MGEGINPVELFDEAKGDDNILSKEEYDEHLAGELTLEDWQAISAEYNHRRRAERATGFSSIDKQPVIAFDDDSVLVKNSEHDLRVKGIGDSLLGVRDFALASGGGLALGWLANRGFSVGSFTLNSVPHGKKIGLALGLVAGHFLYKARTAEYNAITESAMPLKISKGSLKLSDFMALKE